MARLFKINSSGQWLHALTQDSGTITKSIKKVLGTGFLYLDNKLQSSNNITKCIFKKLYKQQKVQKLNVYKIRQSSDE